MPIAYTSRIAYQEIQEELTGLRAEVWKAIRDWGDPGPSIEDLAAALGRKESSICGRIDELRELGAIEDARVKLSATTGKHQKTYRARVYQSTPPTNRNDGQLSLF